MPTACSWDDLSDLPLAPGVDRLHRRFLARYAELGQRLYTEDTPVQARNAAILAAYRATPGQPAILRRARVLTEFAARVPVVLDPDDLLAGTQAFNRGLWTDHAVSEEARGLGYAGTTGHIVHDYAVLLCHGIDGLRRMIASRHATATTAQQVVLDGFYNALEAFAIYVARHAETAAADGHPLATDLRHLAAAPPATFRQAVQFTWFAQCFLHAENPSAAISFGRLDQYLWPFLRDDLTAGRTTPAEAFNLVCAFFLKCCEGEESQNAVLGGVDAAGEDATNPLSLLCLAAMRRMAVFQPSLCVRIHPGTPADFLRAACALTAAGTGNPGFMNDPVVIAGLEAVGIPRARARDWGVVGCYEATPQGDCYPNTVLGRLHLVDALAGYLTTDAGRRAGDFDTFLAGLYAHIDGCYAETLAACTAAWRHFRDHAPSPFGSLLMGDCLARALPLEAGGARINLVGINILGLGTLVDSLHAVRTAVFREGLVSLAALADAMQADFPDETLYARLRETPERYGTDEPATNALVRDVSTTLARMVLASRLDDGARPYPAFFAFSADIYAVDAASPDGRRAGECISYGVGASQATVTTPTALLASAAHAAHELAACGAPLALTLQRDDVAGPDGWRTVQALVAGYFARGGMHLHVNLASADDLRRAQSDPRRAPDLTVRVSGYSARFVTVDRRWQDALIERAERGR
jgi:formate C-acetyltransferase